MGHGRKWREMGEGKIIQIQYTHMKFKNKYKKQKFLLKMVELASHTPTAFGSHCFCHQSALQTVLVGISIAAMKYTTTKKQEGEGSVHLPYTSILQFIIKGNQPGQEHGGMG